MKKIVEGVNIEFMEVVYCGKNEELKYYIIKIEEKEFRFRD